MASPHFYTTFPGKQIYLITTLTSNLLSLPFYLTYYLFPPNRPCPKWTYNQSLRILLAKAFVKYLSTTQSGTILSLHPKTEGTRFHTIDPAPATYYQGISTSNPSIIPSTIGGTWYPSPPPPSEAPRHLKIILHFHGGAYVVGDGRTKDTGFAAQTFLSHTNATHVFCPQYRLSHTPNGRFPAALQDAITSYYFLTFTLQIPPENIVVSGDSAGGNLTLTLLRYLHDNPSIALPPPSCAWLWSPWVDIASSVTPSQSAPNPRAKTDYVDEKFGRWGAKGLAPLEGPGITLTHPYISYIGHAFKSPTPMFFTVGECEMLFEDVLRVYGEFGEVGNQTRLRVDGGAVHDIMLIGRVVGFEEEAGEAVREAGEFWGWGCRG